MMLVVEEDLTTHICVLVTNGPLVFVLVRASFVYKELKDGATKKPPVVQLY